MYLISGDFVAYCKFPRRTTFQTTKSATQQTYNVLTSHHSRTSSVPHVSSSSATLQVLIRPWTTVKPSGPVWSPDQGTGTADQAELAKLGSAQLNRMSLHSTLL